MDYRITAEFTVTVADQQLLQQQALAAIEKSMGPDGHVLSDQGVGQGANQALAMAIEQFGDAAVLQFALFYGLAELPRIMGGSISGIADANISRPTAV